MLKNTILYGHLITFVALHIQKVFVCGCWIWIGDKLLFWILRLKSFFLKRIILTYSKTGLGYESNCLLIVNYNERKWKKRVLEMKSRKDPIIQRNYRHIVIHIYIYILYEWIYIWRLTLKIILIITRLKWLQAKPHILHLNHNEEFIFVLSHIYFCKYIYTFFPSVC